MCVELQKVKISFAFVYLLSLVISKNKNYLIKNINAYIYWFLRKFRQIILNLTKQLIFSWIIRRWVSENDVRLTQDLLAEVALWKNA